MPEDYESVLASRDRLLEQIIRERIEFMKLIVMLLQHIEKRDARRS